MHGFSTEELTNDWIQMQKPMPLQMVWWQQTNVFRRRPSLASILTPIQLSPSSDILIGQMNVIAANVL